ncbi:hypothetical protein sscle_03g029660 [Sclerotinia sclerotiorum 1980 UF-70]|uniref:C2H2-type domain-containing protein n=1 Tax=Sclerotinia sclerotiorum (strain ATCC 18683 / 1980 / Ss-1) TaxID=665079 RepID=A0A1D9PZW3_SCLS1|nr:hypothetical protein sscle_03g029660 [Sclerotinia sclerotiorum 1980 UF-70]
MDFGDGSNDLVSSYNYQFTPSGFDQFGTTSNPELQLPWNADHTLAIETAPGFSTHTQQQHLGRTNRLPHAQADRLPLLQSSAVHQAEKQDTTPEQRKENEQRPHKCTIQGCKVDPFKNPADLRRHKISVHGDPKFFCPVVTCKFHKKGFGRKDNLTEHKRRVHVPVLLSPVATLETTTQDLQTASFEDEDMDDWSLAATPGGMENRSNDNSPTIAFVLQRLVGLRMSLQNIDLEIRALEMTLTHL